jgi:hypothetical protein
MGLGFFLLEYRALIKAKFEPYLGFLHSQEIETLINEEALLFAQYLRNERRKWNPRTARETKNVLRQWDDPSHFLLIWYLCLARYATTNTPPTIQIRLTRAMFGSGRNTNSSQKKMSKAMTDDRRLSFGIGAFPLSISHRRCAPFRAGVSGRNMAAKRPKNGRSRRAPSQYCFAGLSQGVAEYSGMKTALMTKTTYVRRTGKNIKIDQTILKASLHEFSNLALLQKTKSKITVVKKHRPTKLIIPMRKKPDQLTKSFGSCFGSHGKPNE